MRISDWSSDVCSSDLTTVPGRIVFDSVPAGLAARPVLSAVVVSETAGDAVLDLGYLTGGLDWRADYVGRLDGDALALRGLATITNTSGADYNGATVRLVAGAPNRLAPPRPAMLRRSTEHTSAIQSIMRHPHAVI